MRNRNNYNLHVTIEILLVFTFVPFFQVLSQWIPQPSETTHLLRDIVMLDSIHGWAIGDSGTVLKTNNGGELWQKDTSFSRNIEFVKIQFIDSNYGFIAGNVVTKYQFYQIRRSIVFKTINSGQEWKQCIDIPDTSASIGDMHFVNTSTGYISNNNNGQISWEERGGGIYKTTNGGETWEIIENKKGFINGAFEIDSEGVGYSFWSESIDNTSNTVVEVTVTGGLEWYQVGTIYQDQIKIIKIINRDSIWVIGNNISLSLDSGKTWKSWNMSNSLLSGGKRFIPVDIEILANRKIVLFGTALSSARDIDGRIIVSKDMGLNWNLQYTLANNSFNAGYILNNRHAWIVGAKGLILYSANILTRRNQDINNMEMQYDLKQNYPNPFNTSTEIEIFIPKTTFVTINIYDVLGKKIKTLAKDYLQAGITKYSWDGDDDNMNSVSSGIYLIQMAIKDKYTNSKKLILLK